MIHARQLRRLCSSDGRLFLKSVVLLALIRLGLSGFPFQSLRHMLARLSAIPPATDGSAASDIIDRVQWAVDRASRFVPGARHCLTQALTAQFLLAREGRSTQLRIGVAKDEAGRLIAHAWLESDGIAIFGEPNPGRQEYHLLPHLDRA